MDKLSVHLSVIGVPHGSYHQDITGRERWEREGKREKEKERDGKEREKEREGKKGRERERKGKKERGRKRQN